MTIGVPIVSVFLVFYLATKVLQNLNCCCEATVVELVDDQVAAQLSELDGIDQFSLPRCEFRYEQKVIVDLITAKAFVTQSDPLVIQETLLEAKYDSLDTPHNILYLLMQQLRPHVSLWLLGHFRLQVLLSQGKSCNNGSDQHQSCQHFF